MGPIFTKTVLVTGVLGCACAWADAPIEERRSGADPVASWETVVRGPRLAATGDILDSEELLADPAANVGVVLNKLPGGAAARRGADATEPILRGLGGERVQTRLAGVPLYGACPSKMDPPIVYIEPLALDQLLITPGLPSVADGPVGLGGNLQGSFDYRRRADAPDEAQAQIAGSYDFARDGGQLAAAVSGGNRIADLRGTVSASKLGDYRSADGRLVPAQSRHVGTTASIGLRPTPNQRWWQGLVYRRDGLTSFPALPMDAVSSDFIFYGTTYDIQLDGPLWRSVLLRGGISHVSHVMDNALKANRGQLEARTPSNTTTFSAGARADLRATGNITLRVGADVNGVLRDATRTRVIVSSGTVFRDHLWPDARQLDIGLFTEADARLSPELRLRNGLRLDVVASDAAAAGDVMAGGSTVLAQYERFYGPVGDVRRTEVGVAANSVLQWLPGAGATLHAGLGFSTRPAGITERYFAFGPVPGGFQVGDPSLRAEQKLAFEIGGKWRRRWLALHGSASYALVHHFILPTKLTTEDVNGDGVQDIVRGFRNVDAHLLSFALLATVRPIDHLELPLGIGYTWGRNGSDDRPLPEIPPLWARAAIRLFAGNQYRTWIESGVRVTAAQRLVDSAFPEDPTGAYALLHVRGGVELSQALRVELIAENLLNTTYHDHLMREAVLPAGGLAAGDEIPEPGRRMMIALRGQI